MSDLATKLAELKGRGQPGLIAYVTAGDPNLDELPAILNALQEGGADAIEIGIPFSDPIADGPVIQASSQRSLDRGVTVAQIFRKLQEFHNGNPNHLPLIVMGYANPILRMGWADFSDTAVKSGVSGVIVCDMIPDQASEWNATAHAAGLNTIWLAAPTSTPDRISIVVRESRGFVYAVSRTGVTGAGELETDLGEFLSAIHAQTELPIYVGFGIRTAHDVRRVVTAGADGAIVGSVLVEKLAQGFKKDEIVELIRDLKTGTMK